jgi:MerR family transcriptional regulator, light-induced transcriptional regulator
VRALPTNADGTPLTGRLRIAAVSELTGVPEPTLRAWERRYGVPRPERTGSGYRYYGPVEVQQIRNMQRLCESGVPAAEAARVVSNLPTPNVPATRTPNGHNAFSEMASAMVQAVERFDMESLDERLRSTMLMGSTSDIIDHVLTPAMRTIGDKWHAGEISVANEHAASQRIGQAIRDLVRLASPRDHHGLIVLGAFADDEHELGVLTTAARVSTWGYRPIVLGARTPPSAIRDAVEALHPKLVALSVTIPPSGARARELVDDYAQAASGVPWVVGGAGVASIADRVRAAGGRIGPDDHTGLEAVVREAVAQYDAAHAKPAKRRR